MAESRHSTRRAFLKTAPLAAVAMTLPVAGCVEAVSASTVSGIEKLIAQHEIANAAYMEADEFESACHQEPSRPAWPHVDASEFSPVFRYAVKDCGYGFRSSIEQLFVLLIRSLEAQRLMLTRKVWNERIAFCRAEEAKILALFDEREAVYEQWAQWSGLRQAQAMCEERGKILTKIEMAILDYQPMTFEEVRVKTTFFLKNWDETSDKDQFVRMIRSLAPTT